MLVPCLQDVWYGNQRNFIQANICLVVLYYFNTCGGNNTRNWPWMCCLFDQRKELYRPYHKSHTFRPVEWQLDLLLQVLCCFKVSCVMATMMRFFFFSNIRPDDATQLIFIFILEGRSFLINNPSKNMTVSNE